MYNERITEDIVREHFKKDKLFNSIIIDEQKTKNPKIQKLLKNASKSGYGIGKPEFIIYGFKFPFNNLVIVIECKADIKKHKSTFGDRYSEYAVDGVKLYASYLNKEFDVLAIAVSGQSKDDIKVSYFYYRQGSNEEINLDLENDKLYILEDYLEVIKLKNKKEFNLEQLRDFAKKLNDDLHNHSIPEDKRAFLLSGILLALNRDSGFRTSYKNYSKPDRLANLLVNSITDILNNENIASIKKETLTLEYSFIKTHHSLIEQNDEDYDDMYIKRIIEQIEENVAKPLEDSKNQKYIDAIGEMYTEFLRYANNEAKLGIVLTPPHITEFMCDLIDINKDDTVIDICCGTAGFLIAAMTKMIKDCKNDSEKIDYIKKNQIIGIEEKSNIHALGCANMILHGDGKSHIIQLDCFKANKNTYFYNKKITKALLNPPYKAKESPAKQLEFVEKSLELLEPNGKCAAIVQMSCAIKNDKKVKQIKSKILSKHTLEAVISMPDDLFYPVGVVTCIMIFTAHVKHTKNYNTWFGYLKDDGFEKRKHKGRVDLKNKWNDIKYYFIQLLKNKQEKVGISIQHYVEYCNEWCAEAYMKTDYSILRDSHFKKTMQKYLSYLVLENDKENILFNTSSINNKKIVLNTDEWQYFKYNEIFKILKGKRLTKIHQIKGNIPYISSSSFNNGLDNYIDNGITHYAPFLTIACYGSIGEVFFQKDDSWVSDNCNVLYILEDIEKTKNGLKLKDNLILNKYIGMFLVTVIYLEKYRYSYGVTAKSERLNDSIIKLPAKFINNKYQPDWEYMENYIKSLPYSSSI